MFLSVYTNKNAPIFVAIGAIVFAALA